MDATWEAYGHECARLEGALSSSESSGDEQEGDSSDNLKQNAVKEPGPMVRGADVPSWAVVRYAPLQAGRGKTPIIPPLPKDGKDVLSGMKKVIRAFVTQCYRE